MTLGPAGSSQLILNPDGTAQKKIQGTKYTYKFFPNNIVIFLKFV